MAGTNLLPGWAGVVEAVMLAALAILAIAIMVRAVPMADILKHVGTIVGVGMLLILLPAIMAGLWHSMTYWQHLGVMSLGIAILFFVVRSNRRPQNVRRR